MIIFVPVKYEMKSSLNTDYEVSIGGGMAISIQAYVRRLIRCINKLKGR